jgi:hypothetical protein
MNVSMKPGRVLFIAFLILFIIITVSYLADSYWRQKIKKSENSELVIPPYNSGLVYQREPIRSIPLGYFGAIEDPDSDVDGSVYIGADPEQIPAGTHVFIIGMGFRIAIPDKQAGKKTIIVYENIKQTRLFLWAVISRNQDPGHPRIAEV